MLQLVHSSISTSFSPQVFVSVPIQPNLVPPAALVTFVQRGLQHMEAEANLDLLVPTRLAAAVGALQH
jgi:hypothetical protein